MNAKQKASIRAYWPHFQLRFTKDGRVLARKSAGSPWGVLYTAEQLKQHLYAVGLSSFSV